MKYLIFLLIIFALHKANAQKQNLNLSAGIAFNGTGDSKGLIYKAEFRRYLKKSKFFWNASLGGTIHDGHSPLFYEFPVGQINDGSVRYTTAGLQTAFHFGKNFLKSNKNEIYLELGCVVRYQSSSSPDGYSIYYPSITNLPFPVIAFNNMLPQKTLAIGPSLQTGYSHIFNKKYLLVLWRQCKQIHKAILFRVCS